MKYWLNLPKSWSNPVLRSLFISDLHLTPGRPDITRAFLRFLEQDAPSAQSLYILGDFFEYWIGDDVMDEFHHQIATALKALTEKGVSIFVMHGNRDFLIGKSFCRIAGCTWLKDPTVITLGDKPVLLMHGDSLCTSDAGYIRFRKIIQNPITKFILLALPSSYRRNIARKLRENSMANAGKKPPAILDVTKGAVISEMAKHKVKTLIHGHTHRAAVHPLDNNAQRIVLGDWDRLGWSLCHDENGFDLSSFPIS
ncbi:UDP-2,3-diacylglucosamine diphosphatase [Parendozoicomonas sp. Alg238-R29]|uniref:UDP-2,3-diacylglucosamine diphosphatase n=1 Tax=Parendozoicomonas sp. Alg238-R29 TaxID=2993446 RepID=UPI00248F2CEA|nr:UDP-2,3-diacylglucosamine diphosphatase [Parendozoicomonas sp. Alg238-R29]